MMEDGIQEAGWRTAQTARRRSWMEVEGMLHDVSVISFQNLEPMFNSTEILKSKKDSLIKN